MEDKIFKTYEQQLEGLRVRGLDVKPDKESIDILRKENYYNLINGYKNPFLNPNKTTEIFIDGSSLTEIHGLYKFDRNIRALYLKEILKIENMVKSNIAYVFSEEHGYKDREYLNPCNFKVVENNKDYVKFNEFRCKLIREIWGKTNPQDYIIHYRNEHGYVPLWVLVNSMTFGDISKFYSYMNQQEKVNVSKALSVNRQINNSDLDTYLKLIGVFRNILAHDERFYEYKGVNNMGQSYKVKFKGFLGLKNVNSSVFALTICLKLLLEKEDFKEFWNNVAGEIDVLESALKSIGIDEILKRMNFIIPSYGLKSLSDIKNIFS